MQVCTTEELGGGASGQYPNDDDFFYSHHLSIEVVRRNKMLITLSSARRDGALVRKFSNLLKLRCCHGQLSSFPMVTIVAGNFARFAVSDVNADKLPLETEPVARDNNTS